MAHLRDDVRGRVDDLPIHGYKRSDDALNHIAGAVLQGREHSKGAGGAVGAALLGGVRGSYECRRDFDDVRRRRLGRVLIGGPETPVEAAVAALECLVEPHTDGIHAEGEASRLWYVG